MREIQPFAVEQWLKQLKLAPKSKAHIRSLMRILFNSAMRYGFIPVAQNPMSLVRVPGCTKREREPRVLTGDECRQVLGYLDDPWRTMALVARCLGLRVSEILGLQWSDFDFDHNTVLVQRGWVVGKAGDVKTRYSRKQIPLDPSLITPCSPTGANTSAATGYSPIRIPNGLGGHTTSSTNEFLRLA